MTWNQRQIRKWDIEFGVTLFLVVALAALNGALYFKLWGLI